MSFGKLSNVVTSGHWHMLSVTLRGDNFTPIGVGDFGLSQQATIAEDVRVAPEWTVKHLPHSYGPVVLISTVSGNTTTTSLRSQLMGSLRRVTMRS